VDYKLGDISGVLCAIPVLTFQQLWRPLGLFAEHWTFNAPPANTSNADGNMSFGAQIRRPVEVIGSLVAGGKHVWNRWVLAYDLFGRPRQFGRPRVCFR